MTNLLYTLLISGASIVASGVIGAFAKEGGKTAFEALKARLSERHGAKSLALLEDAKDNLAYESAIKADLAKPGVSADTELRQLAETLRKAITALPATEAQYAVDIEEIRSGDSLIIEDNAGVRAKSATSSGPMTIKGNKPPGN